MFILRKITGKGVPMNFVLGKRYTIVSQFTNQEDFDVLAKEYGYTNDPDIYSFIVDEDCKAHQLSKKQKAFIMTDSGRTFENVSME